jgi:hypothetical protein
MYYIRIGAAAAAGGDDVGGGGGGGSGQSQPKQPDAASLYHYCRNCGHEVKIEKTICVSKLQLKRTAQSYSNVINKYTKLDPTLPRIYNIKCPNSQCKSNPSIGDAAAAGAAAIKMKPRVGNKEEEEDEEEAYEDLDADADVGAARAGDFTFSSRELEPREVIYIRYDEVNMKYVYMCTVCDTVWNTAQSNIL